MNVLNKLYYAIKTFIYLQWNARKTAEMLDDVMRSLGQMQHPSPCKMVCKKCDKEQVFENPDAGRMTMTISERSDLIRRGYWGTLPEGWKWRN